MEIKEMNVEELEARKAQIGVDCEVEGADTDALLEEVRAINAELETRKQVAANQEEIRQAVAVSNDVTIIEEVKEVRTTMNDVEIRNSKEYIDAYANFIKTGKDAECRALLTVNATDPTAGIVGQVPVPEYLEGRIKTAWERSEVMNLVKKTFLKGDIKIGFELSATGAVVHKEGTDAPAEEEITLGIINIKADYIKKWILVSDLALVEGMGSTEFLNYIYDELTYRIAKKAEEILVDLIVNAEETASATAVGVPQLEAAPALETVVTALAKLSGEARNVNLVMSRGTYAFFKSVQYAANYAMDIFEGYRVTFTDQLPDYESAEEGDVYMIVGDFGLGVQANFPDGDSIKIIEDPYSLAEADLVKFVGKELVGIGLVADKALVNVVKPEA